MSPVSAKSEPLVTRIIRAHVPTSAPVGVPETIPELELMDIQPQEFVLRDHVRTDPPSGSLAGIEKVRSAPATIEGWALTGPIVTGSFTFVTVTKIDPVTVSGPRLART
jgi:hypothetical protein